MCKIKKNCYYIKKNTPEVSYKNKLLLRFKPFYSALKCIKNKNKCSVKKTKLQLVKMYTNNYFIVNLIFV